MPRSDEPVFHLTSIRFSHFAEKVRWTMDYLGVAYTEFSVLPGLHFTVTPFLIGANGKSDSHSTRFSTPIVKTDRGEVLQKSSNIMNYLDERFRKGNGLYPNDEVRKLDEYYNQTLGPATRRVFYGNAMQNKALLFELVDKNAGALQAAFFKTFSFVLIRAIEKSLGIISEKISESVETVYREFETVEKILKDGRPFLVGDQFTAADITFASLGGIMCLPQFDEGFGARLPDLNCDSAALVKIAHDLRSSEAGKWVVKLFKEQHGRRKIPY
jgi:glutathione S-transferase